MEKRHDFGIIIFRRLLKKLSKAKYVSCVLLFLSAGKIYCSAGNTNDSFRELCVKSKSEFILAGEECAFELFIPDTEPESVQIGSFDFPTEIIFKSLKRTKSSGRNLGTQIEFVLIFPKEGDYTLTPLSVIIGGKNYSIPFETFNVKADPKNLLPIIFAITDDGFELAESGNDEGLIAEAGKAIYFTVYIKNAAQFFSLSWETPKDSLFSEIETYAFAENNNEIEKPIPLAKFEWIPLKAGNQPLPEIKAFVSAYSGAREEISFPKTEIKITHVKKGVSRTDKNDFFERAFEKSPGTDEKNIFTGISTEDCTKLADLRSKERLSFMFQNVRHERKLFEAALGIKNEKPENNFFILLTLTAVAFLSVIAFFILLAMRKIPAFIIFLSVSLALCFAAAFYAINFFAVHGIFTGTEIYSVPEKKSSVFPYPQGKLISIKNSAGGWYYISSEQGSGWILKDDVIIIK